MLKVTIINLDTQEELINEECEAAASVMIMPGKKDGEVEHTAAILGMMEITDAAHMYNILESVMRELKKGTEEDMPPGMFDLCIAMAKKSATEEVTGTATPIKEDAYPGHLRLLLNELTGKE